MFALAAAFRSCVRLESVSVDLRCVEDSLWMSESSWDLLRESLAHVPPGALNFLA